MRRSWLGWAALVLLIGTFFMPGWKVARPVYDLVAVMDITGSMNVRDQQADGVTISRLAMEKNAVRGLLGALPCGSRLGVAIFVEERPFLLFEPTEVCGNFAALDASIAGIDWKMGWDSESHIAAAAVAALGMARGLSADLVFFTDGQEMPPMAWSTPPDYGAVRGAANGVIMGVGGHVFSPIPKFNKAGQEIGCWKPGQVPSETGGLFQGHEYLSAVDEPHLRTLAGQTGLSYFHLEGERGLLGVISGKVTRKMRESAVDLRAVPGGVALFLLVIQGSSSFLKKRRRPPGGTKKLLFLSVFRAPRYFRDDALG